MLVPTDLQGRRLLAAQRAADLRCAGAARLRPSSPAAAVLRRRVGGVLIAAGRRLAGETLLPGVAGLGAARSR